MKILYDHLGFMEKYGGVSRYYSKMISNLPENIDYEIAVKFSSNDYLPLVKSESCIPFIRKDFLHKERLYSEFNKPNSIHYLKKGDYDIYHMTHCDPYGFKYVPAGKENVMTVHDLNFVMLPGIVKENFSLKVWQRESADIVDAIITVSENTKKDMIEQWHISPEKITVIYHGAPELDVSAYSDIRPVGGNYILYVGSRSNFKNFSLLATVFSSLHKRYDNINLVCTGNSFSPEEVDFLKSLEILNFVKHIAASDSELFALYAHALCYVYPSFYEGFGIPLLEAMACGCPVVCSRASCFPEIAGKAAFYFDPHSEDELTKALSEVIDSQSVRKNLITAGFENIKRFSWKACGAQHAAFYRNLLS